MEADISEGDPALLVPHLIFFSAAGSIEHIVLAGVLLLLLGCSALVSGSEVAYFSFNSQQVQAFGKSSSKPLQSVFNLISRPRYLLATILIANNLVNIAFILISNYLFEAVFDFSPQPGWPDWLAKLPLNWVIKVPLVTALIVLFGEVLPKVYAMAKSQQLAAFMAQPLVVLRKLFMPLSKWLVNSTQAVEKRLSGHEKDAVSVEDIDMVIDLTTDVKTSADDVKMLKSIVRFGDILVKDIMTARPDIRAVQENTSYDKVLEVVRETGHSRIPVFADKIDNIKGVLYTKDLIKYLDEPPKFKWQKVMRKTHFVPENKRVDDLLEDFQTHRMHIALVVDEYGGTVGLITLEDILEEVVGDIKDEFEGQGSDDNFQKIAENTYIFEGKASLYDVCKKMGVGFNQFDDVKGETDSLAGLVLEIAGKIPRREEEIHFPPFTFTVLSADKMRIKRIKVVVDETN